jgi:hypothetical protein
MQAIDQVADVVTDVPHVQVLSPPVAGIEDLAEVGEGSTLCRSSTTRGFSTSIVRSMDRRIALPPRLTSSVRDATTFS